MVELQWKSRMAAPEISSPATSPPLLQLPANNKTTPSSPSGTRVPDNSAIMAYEHYLRLPELSQLCTSINFPDWPDESIVKPALQALEITFRLVSISLSDPRPYSNQRQWKQRLESLACCQVEIIALLCSSDNTNTNTNTNVPVADLVAPRGVMARQKSSQEVWSLRGTATAVSHTSEASLLPRLASWEKSEEIATRILLQIECQMHRCPFTLGLGEPNLSGKPTLEYDEIVTPSNLHAIKKSASQLIKSNQNQENQMLFTIHQILESWLCTAQQLLKRIAERIGASQLDEAGSDAWLLERIWKLLSQVEELHLLMDPADFLRLKSQLAIRATSGSEAFCFRSGMLLQVTNLSKDLKHKVPQILGVEVDPNGGPRVQEAAMRLFHSRRRGEGGDNSGRVHLLQALQAVEAAVKEFFFGYRQLVTAVMGSLEANGNRGLSTVSVESMDSLTQMFMDPPYFPSIDAAKTFLGEAIWQHESSNSNGILKHSSD